MTFSSTVMPRKSCVVWNVRVRPRAAIRLAAGPVTGEPSRSTAPRVGPLEAADHVQERGLPRPVRPDDAANLAALRPRDHAVERADAAERDREIADGEHRPVAAATRGRAAITRHRSSARRRHGGGRRHAAQRLLPSGHAPPQQRDQALGQEDDREHQHEAERDLLGALERPERLLDADEEGRSQHGAPHRAEPAHHDHAEVHDHLEEVESLGRDEVERGRVEPAGRPRVERAHREGERLRAREVDAERLRGHLAVAHRDHRAPDARADGVPGGDDERGRDREREVVHAGRARHAEPAKSSAAAP